MRAHAQAHARYMHTHPHPAYLHLPQVRKHWTSQLPQGISAGQGRLDMAKLDNPSRTHARYLLPTPMGGLAAPRTCVRTSHFCVKF
jgi:hypothetical protein